MRLQHSVLALQCATLVVMLGCTKTPNTQLAPGAMTEAKNPACQVPSVPPLLGSAICSGDTNQIRDALFKVRASSPTASEHAEIIAVVRHLWEADKGFGTQLPWNQLTDVQNKGLFVDVLAQAYRNHETDVPLGDLQKFASNLASSDRDDMDYYEGVRLLGITDQTDAVPLLKRIALSNDPSPRRRSAIEALGNICDATAMQALKELSVSLAGKQPDSMLVRKAIELRTDLDSSWCRKSATQ
jgi:hypothetical protein